MKQSSDESGTRAAAKAGQPPRQIRRLRWLHASIVLSSLLVTLGAWQYASHTLDERNRLRFDRQTEQVVEQVRERLDSHASLLRATVGFIEATGDDDVPGWRNFVGALGLEERFPELVGLAAVRHVPNRQLTAFLYEKRVVQPTFALYPAHRQSYHLPVVLVSPDTLADSVNGYDLAFDATRREAFERAVARNEVTLTAPLRPTGEATPGAVMVAPYRVGNTGHRGAIVTSMLFEQLARGALAPARRTIRMSISDGGETMFDELSNRSDTALDPRPLFEKQIVLRVYDREWRIDMHSTRGFRTDAGIATPWLVLMFGLCIDALLILLLWFQDRAGQRLLIAARKLRGERRALAQSNEKLETFACVVSHDLKAPLLGIRCLIDVVEDDLDADGPDLRQGILAHLDKMRERITRTDAMIDGVLAYSGFGSHEPVIDTVDIGALVHEIGATLDIGNRALRFTGDTTPLSTDRVRLVQVLENLIGNAFKYHHDPVRARVRVDVKEADDDWLQIRVIDNGRGIDPALREQVFEPFVTGHGTERTDSTGVGLAIVRKAVESVGGRVSAEPTPGGGATIAFTWPRQPGDEAETVAPLLGADELDDADPGLRMAA